MTSRLSLFCHCFVIVMALLCHCFGIVFCIINLGECMILSVFEGVPVGIFME